MASPDPKEDVAKRRIISHMNADHQDSVIRYAEYFCKLSLFSARNARIHNVSLDHLEITAGGRNYRVPLDPPLESWREARERFIQMDKTASAALSRSDVTVREYRRPKGFHAVVFTACVLTYAMLCRRQNCMPGSYFYDYVLSYVPAFARFLVAIQPVVFYGMVALHLTEASFMHRRRLLKHTVPPLSRVWWLWAVSTFIEGVGAFQRFDALVQEKGAAKDAQRH